MPFTCNGSNKWLSISDDENTTSTVWDAFKYSNLPALSMASLNDETAVKIRREGHLSDPKWNLLRKFRPMMAM